MSQPSTPPLPGRLPRYWDDEQVDHFITSEAHTKTKTPEQFRETHVDIDRIYADTLTPLGVSGQFVTQDDLLDAITRSNLDDANRIFILRGEPGSGKSQLCEWLKYQLNGFGEADDGYDGYVALHVSRSQTRIDQITEVLTDPLDVDPDVGNVEDLTPEAAASAIVEYLRGIWSTDHFTHEELEELTAKRGDGSDLRELFAANIRAYQGAIASRDESPDFNLLTRADFRDLRLRMSFSDKLTENKDLLFPVLKNEAHEYLSRNLVGDFQEQLRDYSELYQRRGLRPVLICEDLTTFSVLKEQLLDHIFELSSSCYDIVLGWTIGWEQDNINDALPRSDAAEYMQGRSEGYLTLTDENGEAFFLDDSASIALTRTYMDAIKRNSAGRDVPGEVEAAFDGLYPFTERFIQTAYVHLNDKGSNRKTPRLLLLRVVKHCLKSTIAPYEAMKSNAFVDTPAPNIAMRYDELYLDLARWYGIPVSADGTVVNASAIPPNGGIGIRVEILETFGVDPPEDAPVRGGYVVFEEGEASKIIGLLGRGVGRRGGGHDRGHDDEASPTDSPDGRPVDGADDGASRGGDGSEDGIDSVDDETAGDGGPAGTSEEERKIQEFLDWVKSGEEYPSADTLHAGAVATLEMWHDPTRLANPNASTSNVGAIYYAGGDGVPVSIEGAQTRRATVQVTVTQDEDNVPLYRPMVEFGILGEFVPERTNFDRLRAWSDTNVAAFKRDMREAIEGCLPPELTIEKTLVLARFLLMNAARGFEPEGDEFPTEVIFEEYHTDLPYDHPLVERFDRTSAFGRARENLTKSSSDINGLVEGFFLLKETVVDYDRLSTAGRAVMEDLEAHIDAAMMIDADDLADAYRIGTSRHRAQLAVKTLFDRISEYATELQRLTAEEDAEHVREALDPVDRWYDPSHTASDLAEWFETLEACRGVMDVSDKTQYERARDLLGLDDEDGSPVDLGLASFREDVDLFRGIDEATGIGLVARLHDFARSRHEQAAWDVYEAFDRLVEALQAEEHATGSDLEHRVTQLDEYADYESKRRTILSVTEDL
jgi:hypothetical protein